MVRWVDGWMDGGMGGRMDGWMHVLMDGWVVGIGGVAVFRGSEALTSGDGILRG